MTEAAQVYRSVAAEFQDVLSGHGRGRSPSIVSMLLRGLLVFCASGSIVHGATFTPLCKGPVAARMGCAILLEGPIAKGDADKLTNVLRSRPAVGEAWYQLALNSDGGDVQEAMRLGAIVRRATLATSTTRDDIEIQRALASPRSTFLTCASACVLVWIAGVRRHHMSVNMQDVGNVGLALHRPYFSKDAYVRTTPEQLALATQKSMDSVRQYLKSEGMPEALIEEMFSRSSRDVRWLDNDEKLVASIPELAPWYEETLIARCRYDPELVRERSRIFDQHMKGPATAENRLEELRRFRNTPASRRFDEIGVWLDGILECEAKQIRLPAQHALRKGS